MSCSTSATGIELVTTVRCGTLASRLASAHVVEPAVSAIATPGLTSETARPAIAFFSASSRTDFEANVGFLGGRADPGRAAVHLCHEPALGQHVEVSPDSHVGDAE